MTTSRLYRASTVSSSLGFLCRRWSLFWLSLTRSYAWKRSNTRERFFLTLTLHWSPVPLNTVRLPEEQNTSFFDLFTRLLHWLFVIMTQSNTQSQTAGVCRMISIFTKRDNNIVINSKKKSGYTPNNNATQSVNFSHYIYPYGNIISVNTLSKKTIKLSHFLITVPCLCFLFMVRDYFNHKSPYGSLYYHCYCSHLPKTVLTCLGKRQSTATTTKKPTTTTTRGTTSTSPRQGGITTPTPATTTKKPTTKIPDPCKMKIDAVYQGRLCMPPQQRLRYNAVCLLLPMYRF